MYTEAISGDCRANGRRSDLGGHEFSVRAAPGQPVTGEGGFTLIDTHMHFYNPTRAGGVPWPPRDDKLLYRPVLPKD